MRRIRSFIIVSLSCCCTRLIKLGHLYYPYDMEKHMCNAICDSVGFAGRNAVSNIVFAHTWQAFMGLLVPSLVAHRVLYVPMGTLG